MSNLAIEWPAQCRTEAFSGGWGQFHAETGTSHSALDLDPERLVVFTLVAMDDQCVISGGTLAQRILLANSAFLSGREVTSSKPSLLMRGRENAETSTSIRSKQESRTLAQGMVESIRTISGLTNEEIAPLAGVSRRSIQAWIAGEQISARKEQRLRSVLNTILELADSAPQTTRQRILDRAHPGDVRAYDLIAEGHWGAAVDYALGRRRAIDAPATPQTQNLYAQLDHHEGQIELPVERLDRRLSGRLRR